MDFNSRFMDPDLAENICPCPSACNETQYVVFYTFSVYY